MRRDRSLGFLDAVARAARSSSAHARRASPSRSTSARLPDRRRRSTTSSSSGMGGSGIAGDVLAAVGQRDAAGPGHRAEAVPRAPRSSARARSRSRSRTRATPRRPSSMATGVRRSRRTVVARHARAARSATLAREPGAARAVPDRVSCRAPRIGALVAPLFVMLERASGCCPARTRGSSTPQRAARDARREQCQRPTSSAAQPGARARPPDRSHDPADLRRRRARRGRGHAVEVRRQREREGAGVLERVPGARPQRDLRRGASTATSPARCSRWSSCATGSSTRSSSRALRRHPRASSTRRCIQVLRGRRPRARAASRSCSTSCTSATGSSCYLALDNDVDPGPIDAIFQLKDRLPTPDAANRRSRALLAVGHRCGLSSGDPGRLQPCPWACTHGHDEHVAVPGSGRARTPMESMPMTTTDC